MSNISALPPPHFLDVAEISTEELLDTLTTIKQLTPSDIRTADSDTLLEILDNSERVSSMARELLLMRELVDRHPNSQSNTNREPYHDADKIVTVERKGKALIIQAPLPVGRQKGKSWYLYSLVANAMRVYITKNGFPDIRPPVLVTVTRRVRACTALVADNDNYDTTERGRIINAVFRYLNFTDAPINASFLFNVVVDANAEPRIRLKIAPVTDGTIDNTF